MNSQFSPRAGAAVSINQSHLAQDPVVTGYPTENWPHRVSAVYPSMAEAEGLRQELIELGFAASAIEVRHAPAEAPAADTGSDEVLKAVLVDGAIGTAVGTGVGAIGTVALVAANVTLFVASPVLAPLAMLGWFAGLGGVVGAAVGSTAGTSHKEGRFSDLVADAITAGHAVIVVHTHNEEERDLAKRVITASLTGRDESPLESP